MKKRLPVVLSWSGGKDGCLSLLHALQQDAWDIRYLLCTLEAPPMQVKMHGVSEELMRMQAASVGIPLRMVYLYESSNAHYESQLAKALEPLYCEGIRHLMFGDIFLDDLRAYREGLLGSLGWEAAFPLWKMDTGWLIRKFLEEGFRALVCSVNTRCLPADIAGRELDAFFFDELPAGTDACGENGEYHSFCYDGPIFQWPIALRLVGRKSFVMPMQSGDTVGPVICQALLEPFHTKGGIR